MEILTIRQLRQRFRELTALYQAGRIDQAFYFSETHKLQAQDEDGTWWRVDPVHQAYLSYDGQQWLPSSLPSSVFITTVTDGVASDTSTGMMLYYRSSTGDLKEISLTADIVIGRSRDCDLVLDEGAVSRRHARITVLTDGCLLTDLNSSNGTRLNHQLLQPNVPQKLTGGQVISIGKSDFTVVGSHERYGNRIVDSPFLQSPPVHTPFDEGLRAAIQPQPKPEVRPVQQPVYQQSAASTKKSSRNLQLLMISSGVLTCLCVFLAGGILWFTNRQPREAAQNNEAYPVEPIEDDTATPFIEEENETVPVPLPMSTTQATGEVPTDIDDQSDPSNTWLVIFYNDADDLNIEGPLYLNVNEAELVGSNENIQVVTQLDLYQGNFEAPQGDWSTTKRFLLNETEYWDYITSPEIVDLGEQNMGDAETLVDFVVWAIDTYPADRYALIMTDHGDGWMGGFYDEDPNPDVVGQMDVHIELAEFDQALSYITRQTGIGKFDLVGMDACLMSMLEVYTAIAPYAHYAVASEEVEPFFGWAYESFLQDLHDDPSMDGSELAGSIVRSYIEEDFIVNYDDIRQEVFGYGVTRDDVIQQYYPTITLSAVDLSEISALNTALNDYIRILKTVDQSSVAWARTNAQHYQDIFMEEGEPLHASSNIDLGNFVALAADVTGNAELLSASQRVLDAVDHAVIYEKHGDERSDSQGISIYFPVSELYQMTYEQLPYTLIANKFAEESLWDEYLFFHYAQ